MYLSGNIFLSFLVDYKIHKDHITILFLAITTIFQIIVGSNNRVISSVKFCCIFYFMFYLLAFQIVKRKLLIVYISRSISDVGALVPKFV